jgi:WD40 repeat protein
MMFLSHAGEETNAARELARHFRSAGLDVWLDVERLKPGDRWMEEIEKAIRDSKAFLVYVGRSGVQRWVDNEVRVALTRNAKDPDFRIIPVLGPGAEGDSLPLFLSVHQALHADQGVPSFEDLKTLVSMVSGGAAGAVSLLSPGKAPFRGLLAFDVDDAPFFFGRDREIEELLKGLRQSSFMAVVGDSGSGKSSLVRAGLVPALHRGRFHIDHSWVESWKVVICRPGDEPKRALVEAVAELGAEMSPKEKLGFCELALRQVDHDPGNIRNVLSSVLNGPSRRLLVVDQFEEVFTLTPRLEDRLCFIDALLAAPRIDTDRPVHVLIVLRADFYSQCWQHRELPNRIAVNLYPVRRVGRDQLRAIIEKPLELAGAGAEPGLVDAILKDVGDEPGNLPLLEHALLQLWESRQRNVITHAAYLAIGRLAGAIRNHANRVIEENVEERDHVTARHVLIGLTQLGEGTEDTRRRLTIGQLLASGVDSGSCERVLKTLVEYRLVTSSGQDPSGELSKETTIEVAHETLIREWPLLRSWIDADRERLRFERGLLADAEEWAGKLSRDTGGLLRGVRLKQAEEWARRSPRDLHPSIREYLKASVSARELAERDERQNRRAALESTLQLRGEAEARAEAEKRVAQESRQRETEAQDARRKTQQISRILGIATIVSIVLLAYTYWGKRVTESHELAARSRLFLPTDPGAALRLAVHAGERYPTAVAEQALHDSLAAQRLRTVFNHTANIHQASLSADETMVVTASDDGAQVWDVRTGKLTNNLIGHPKNVIDAVFALDGSRILTLGSQDGIRMWRTDTGTSIRAQNATLGSRSFSLSPDGKLLLLATGGNVSIVDLASGEQAGPPLETHQDKVFFCAFSPKGSKILTISPDGVRIWERSTRRLVVGPLAKTGTAQRAAFSPDESKIVTVEQSERKAEIWEVETGRKLQELPHPLSWPLDAVFSPDSARVITAYSGHGFPIWDVRDGSQIGVLGAGLDRGGTMSTDSYVSFSPDGRTILTCGEDDAARLWDAQTGSLRAELRDSAVNVARASFSKDGRLVLTSGGKNAAVWDSGADSMTLSNQTETTSLAFAPNDSALISAGDGMRFWNVATGSQAKTVQMRSEAILGLSLSKDASRILARSAAGCDLVDAGSGAILWTIPVPNASDAVLCADGSRFATIGGDRKALLWDAVKKQLIGPLLEHGTTGATFSPDSSLVAVAGMNKTGGIWNAADGTLIAKLTNIGTYEITGIRFFPDGSALIGTGNDGLMQVWDSKTGASLSTIGSTRSEWFTSIDISKDGSQLVTAARWGDKTSASVWDVKSGRLVQNMIQPGMRAAMFSPSAETVLAISYDGIGIWATSSGRELARFDNPGVRDAAFSPSGELIAVASADKLIRIYPVRYQQWLDVANRRLPPGFIVGEKIP